MTKTLLFLLMGVSVMMILRADGTLAKQQKNILTERSNAAASRHPIHRVDRERRINKGFEWIIQGVNILDQVDNFISDRTKDIIRKLHMAYNHDDPNVYGNINRRYMKRES